MGHYYRERHQEQPGATTSADLTGLGTGAPTDQPSEDWTLEQLRDEAKARDLPYYGTKAEILERLNQ